MVVGVKYGLGCVLRWRRWLCGGREVMGLLLLLWRGRPEGVVLRLGWKSCSTGASSRRCDYGSIAPLRFVLSTASAS